MKKTFLLIIGLSLITLSSCVREEVYIYQDRPDADVIYEYWTGPSGTLIEGEIFNDGNTYLNSVELQVRLYDNRSHLIESEYYWINVYSYPGESSFFTLDLWEPYVSDVEIRVTGFD